MRGGRAQSRNASCSSADRETERWGAREYLGELPRGNHDSASSVQTLQPQSQRPSVHVLTVADLGRSGWRLLFFKVEMETVMVDMDG